MSSIAFSAPSTSVAGFARSSRWGYAKIAGATVAAATLANVLVYFIGAAVVGYDPDFVVLSNVSGTVIFTLAAALVAVLLYGALLRWTANPVKVFAIVSAAVFVVTTVPDFTYIPGVEGGTTGQAGVLVTMHAVAAAVIVGMLTKLAPGKDAR